MGRFQSCKVVVERALRRAFYDGVLELYEGHGGADTVTAVTLEGTLTLTINRVETLLIRLNEVAQRAEETCNDDTGQYSPEEKQASCQNKEQGFGKRKRRKSDVDGSDELEIKTVKKKEIKVEREDIERQKSFAVSDEPSEVSKTPDMSGCNSPSRMTKKTGMLQQHHRATASSESVIIKKEPVRSPADFGSSPETTHCRTALEDPVTASQERSECKDLRETHDLPASVVIKKEPKTESILIDDEEEEFSSTVHGQQGHSGVPQTSPSHSLWYRMPQDSKHRVCPRRKSGRESGDRKPFGSPHKVDTADPHEMALLLERNDCPVCGEVLHNRKELSIHLHAHRHALRSSCSVCHANTLTLDALLLHLSTTHSPRVQPAPATITSDALLSQALVPALPYTHGPMTAIASLVSMAACQASPSLPDATVFMGGNSAMAGGMSSLMEQIIAYRGLFPCPICQLLCSSKQHLAAHLTSMHSDLSPGGQREGWEKDPAEAQSDTQTESKPDSDAEGSTSSSISCFDCSISFSSQAAYTQHCMLHHGTTSVVSQGTCSICHRAFDTWTALHSHYLSGHDITNFCDRCKMGFVSPTELKSHYDSMHGSEEARSLTFICDICNKGFYSQSQCSAHKRSHISEKSFACQVCGSAFFKRGDLSKHFRTVHAPNRVFACRFCGKRGTRMDNMRSHVKSHGKHMTRDEILSFIEEVKS